MMDPQMSNQFWGSVITVLVILGKILDLYLAKRSQEQKDRIAGEQAKATQEVKKALVETTAATTGQISELKDVADQTKVVADKAAVVAGQTHTLVNSEKGANLTALYVALQTIAELTGKPEAISAAAEAKKNLESHQIKQDAVDIKIAQDVGKADKDK